MAFRIVFDRDAITDLEGLRKYDRTAILNDIERHLAEAPAQETGSRIRALRQPAVSQFRLRVGQFRVYYDVDLDDGVVYILRVRVKGSRMTTEVVRDEGS